MGKYSRDKGKRGELDLVHKLGGSARRTGHSFVRSTADVETDFAVYQVKNKTIGGSEIAFQLSILEATTSDKNKYVAFKVRGKFYIAETLKQHQGDHGESPKEEENDT